jgi:acyl dehydratase
MSWLISIRELFLARPHARAKARGLPASILFRRFTWYVFPSSRSSEFQRGVEFEAVQKDPGRWAAAKSEEEPMGGLYFEDFEEGQVFDHAISRTVTEMDNVLFSALTMNPQPLHLDEEFAKQTEFGQRLVNSLFTLGLVIGISVGETTLGTTVANLGMSDARFPKPVFHGDTLRARTIVKSKRRSKSRGDAGIVEFEHQGINQRGETVAICRRAGLMKCRSKEG